MLVISIILEAAVGAIAFLAARNGRPYMYGLVFTFGAYVFYDLARFLRYAGWSWRGPFHRPSKYAWPCCTRASKWQPQPGHRRLGQRWCWYPFRLYNFRELYQAYVLVLLRRPAPRNHTS